METSVQRENILANFQACTGIRDITYSISLLDAHEWNLSEAVESALAVGVSDAELDGSELPMDITPSQLTPTVATKPPSYQTVDSYSSNVPPGVSTLHPTMSSNIATSCPVIETNLISELPQSLIEVDSGPVVTATGHVRILHFEIRLHLPEDGGSSCETFTVPETETVQSLKRQFVEARITELIQLATSPQWLAEASDTLDVTQAGLLQHLQLRPTSSTDPSIFSNDKLTLRELLLPKYNTLDATLSPRRQTPSTTHKRFAGPSNTADNGTPVELHIIEAPYPATSSVSMLTTNVSVATTTHTLRTPATAGVGWIRQNVASLTSVSLPHQFWWLPPTGSAAGDPVVRRLVRELERNSGSTGARRLDSGSGPTLASLGLQPGKQYTVYLSNAHSVSSGNRRLSNSNGRKHHGNSTQVNRISREPPGSTSTVGCESSSKRSTRVVDTKSSESSTSDDSGDDDYAGDMDNDHGFSDSDRLGGCSTNIWNTPLIPDTDSVDDPMVATERFCQVFLQRYCGDGGEAMAPSFATCSMDNALAASVGASSVSARKPFFIYLHHDESVACHVFCQQILCSTDLGRFMSDNGFCLWPWDMTSARARERLLGWLENRIPILTPLITPLPVDSFPVLAMVGKLAGQLEILCVVLGTGRIINSAILHSSDPISFPSMMAMGADVLARQSPNQLNSSMTSSRGTSSGELNVDNIVAQLWQAYTHYTELLQPEIAAEVERQTRKQVREEQEADYQESLRIDRLKAFERVQAEEQARLDSERIEQEKTLAADQAARHRIRMAATLPTEPPLPTAPEAKAFLNTPRGSAGIASLRFRIPPGDVAATSSAADAASVANRGGEVVTRRFAGNDALKSLMAFVEARGYAVSDYKLIATFPRRDVTQLDENLTMAEVNFVPQETLTLERR